MSSHSRSSRGSWGATGLALAAFVLAACCSSAQQLPFDDRVACHDAVERVYWQQRIWPADNPTPKPDLLRVLPRDAVVRRAEDSLAMSLALEERYGRPLTSAQLQAEVDRMVRDTHSPEVLEQLLAALHHDPTLVAECLARPVLARRLLQAAFVLDDRVHGAQAAEVQAEVAAARGVQDLERGTGVVREVRLCWREGVGEPGSAVAEDAAEVDLEPQEWRAELGRLVADSDLAPPAGNAELTPRRLPLGRLSRLEEDEEGWRVHAVVAASDDDLELVTVAWPRRGFDEWWREERTRYLGRTGGELAKRASYRIPPLNRSTCVDSWRPTASPADGCQPRYAHAAVWTGSEMLVWGGLDAAGGYLGSGARYNPATGTWTGISTAGAPDARAGHTAVWTGSEMVVWGGYPAVSPGGRYDPLTDSWRPTSTASAPSSRWGHSAIWTGTEMIVWGGSDGEGDVDTGGRYDPAADSWVVVGTGNAPLGRSNHSAVWTGTEMVIWGGSRADGDSTVYLVSGGRYDPATDGWTTTAVAGAPSGRGGQTAVWTGSEMVIWGGQYCWQVWPDSTVCSFLSGGARYDPAGDSWVATASAGAPASRAGHTAVWSGSEMVVWGGQSCEYVDDGTGVLVEAHCRPFETGGRYDPVADSWSPTSAVSATPERTRHTAVWTGSEVIVWGGYPFAASGGRYDPASDSWVATTAGAAPPQRWSHSAVWTGAEMVVWGGSTYGTYPRSGGRYDPATDAWAATTTVGAPTARAGHTAVWTGSEMVVWGGGQPVTDTGGRYDPTQDQWTATSATGAPSPRFGHAAVWTGTDMVVWGGGTYDDLFDSGGRYAPGSDSWAPTSVSGAPSARLGQAAVWTGSEMIVWGGDSGGSYPQTGGRYDPSGDVWTPTATASAPVGRTGFTAVWTGGDLIVWGGRHPEIDTGGRYHPDSDSWTPTTTAGAPSPRRYHTAVWTGSEMIVWGGRPETDTGGRYNPGSDSWAATTTVDAPSPRSSHTAVWTGSEMIVWGGPTWTGGSYCSPLLFADGFESGTTAAWSQVVP